jgi:hypothetical protein
MVRTIVGGSIATIRASSAWLSPSRPHKEHQHGPLTDADARWPQLLAELMGHGACHAIDEVAEALLDHEVLAVGFRRWVQPMLVSVGPAHTHGPIAHLSSESTSRTCT